MSWCYGVAWLVGLAGFSDRPADQLVLAAVLALVAVVAATRLLAVPRPAGGHRLRVPAAARRERVGRRSVPRLCDPDARGRSRPRAPSPYPSAA
jgi:uncharacterized protein DUF6412